MSKEMNGDAFVIHEILGVKHLSIVGDSDQELIFLAYKIFCKFNQKAIVKHFNFYEQKNENTRFLQTIDYLYSKLLSSSTPDSKIPKYVVVIDGYKEELMNKMKINLNETKTAGSSARKLQNLLANGPNKGIRFIFCSPDPLPDFLNKYTKHIYCKIKTPPKELRTQLGDNVSMKITTLDRESLIYYNNRVKTFRHIVFKKAV
jgi:hypothetical protein